MFLIQSRQVDAGPGHQCSQTGNEAQGFEDHMGGAIAIRCLQLVAHLAVGGQRQAFLGYGRSCDIAAQPFQLVPFPGFGRHTGMQGESP